MHEVCFVFVEQITGETVGEVRPVADMHQRKAEMARHSDCFIALPGLSPSLFLSLSLFSFLSFSPHMMGLFIFLIVFYTTRWLWNTGGVIGSHHMGPAWNP